MSHELGQPLPAGRGSGGAESSVTRRDDDTEPSAPGGNPGGGARLQQVEPAEAAALTPMPAASGRPEASRSLYIGKLHPSVNEAMLLEIFSTLGAVQEVKVIRDKLTSLSAGYGFVTYYDARCDAQTCGSCMEGSCVLCDTVCHATSTVCMLLHLCLVRQRCRLADSACWLPLHHVAHCSMHACMQSEARHACKHAI